MVVCLQCLGMAARRFHLGLESPLGGMMYFEWGWSESVMLQVEDAVAVAMVAAALLTLIRPCWLVLVPVAIWMALVPWAAWQRDEGFIPWLEPVEHAVRFLVPLALAGLEFWPPRRALSRWRAAGVMWLLRIGAALTFIGHGIAALEHNPHFIDLILTAGERLLSVQVSEDTARQALTIIGVVDVAVALNLLWAQLPAVAIWMTFWGLLTAASRLVYFGVDPGYVEFLIRAVNGGAPLALAIWWLRSREPTSHSHSQ